MKRKIINDVDFMNHGFHYVSGYIRVGRQEHYHRYNYLCMGLHWDKFVETMKKDYYHNGLKNFDDYSVDPPDLMYRPDMKKAL